VPHWAISSYSNIPERLVRAADKKRLHARPSRGAWQFLKQTTPTPNGGNRFLSVRESDGQRQRKGLFRTLRLVRHANPIAATHDHKGLPIFGPLGRSIAVAITEIF
jgi:hypothetical protein